MSKCINEVHRALGYIGISGKTITRISNDELHIPRQTPTGNNYDLFIWSEQNDTITFQSIVFKNVYGSSEKELGFYQVLLYYNNYINFANFSIARSEKEDEWDIILTSNQFCNGMNPKTVTQIVRTFDYAYTELVPKLHQQAKKWRLEFNGRIRNDFGRFLSDGLED